MMVPEEMAQRLSKVYQTSNPFLLCDHLNIEIKYVEFGDNPLGQFVRVLNEPLILLNKRLEESPQRYFIAAHELFHALHHSDLTSYYVQTEFTRGKLETEANHFAGILIMNQYKEEHGALPETIQELEIHYGLPFDFVNNYI